MFGKLLQWLKISAAEVPDEIAVCEFDCNKTKCLFGDWQQCDRRLNMQTRQQREMD